MLTGQQLRLLLVLNKLQHAPGLALASTSILKMPPIFTNYKIDQIPDATDNLPMVILSLVKDFSGAFPPLQLAATGAFLIANNVKVSSVYPKRPSTSLLTVHIRASGRAGKSGTSLESMSRKWLPKRHCDGT